MAIKLISRLNKGKTPTSKGNKEYWILDYAPPVIRDGKRTRFEFLKLFTYVKPKDEKQRSHNKETKKSIDIIHASRINQYLKPEIYSSLERQAFETQQASKGSFLDFVMRQADLRADSNRALWLILHLYLKSFRGDVSFADITKSYADDFKLYLKTCDSIRNKKKLSNNTIVMYLNTFRYAMRLAREEGLLKNVIAVDPVKKKDTHRDWVTLDEVRTLANTPCLYPVTKAAALFSCLTGLRYADIKKLVWGEIEHVKAGYQIRYKIKKSGDETTLEISNQAFELLGKRGKPDDLVFPNLKVESTRYLAQWLGAAGISRKITFHSFRHSFATIQLDLGTDIFTISKMLGHRNLSTTQIYAKLNDKLKREAANKITL